MIEVIKPGLYTTIQDQGRISYRKYGVPVSGPADQYSAALSNQILQNHKNSPVLEITIIGPTLKFNKSCKITITGAGFHVTLNEEKININTIVSIPKGSILKFGTTKKGMRAYLAIKGGFKSEIVMGSVSFLHEITKSNYLKKDDLLFFNHPTTAVKHYTKAIETMEVSFRESKLEAFKGPEFDLLSSEIQEKLISKVFKISSQSNRMGTRLISDKIITAKEIITSPVQPGTVQLTPSGQLIILGRDAQTTGGYARVLQLTEEAQNILAQLQFGKPIEFKLIDYQVYE